MYLNPLSIRNCHNDGNERDNSLLRQLIYVAKTSYGWRLVVSLSIYQHDGYIIKCDYLINLCTSSTLEMIQIIEKNNESNSK